MRAKIMLLTAAKEDEAVTAFAEQLLTDLSAAFGHTFSLMEGRIDGEPADKTVDACLACQGVFVSSAEAPGVQELYDALGMPLCIRSFCVPEALCARHEAPVSLCVGSALSLDEETLRQAMRCAFLFAQEQDCRLCAVAPNGSSKADWDAAVRVQEAACPSLSAPALSAPEAVAAMISAPERLGLILCPPYAGSILLSAGTALCSHPELMHDLAFDGEMGVYAPVSPGALTAPLPFAASLALGKLLRFSLRLPREAACVEAAVSNVLSSLGASSRLSDSEPDGNHALDMICEQIAVAGELMRRGGIA